MNVFIMGCGRVGAELARELDTEGHTVTIMDTNGSKFDNLPPEFSGTALVGDGTDEEVLKKAGIDQADAFVALTRQDERNAMAAQIAKQVFGVPRVVCRIYDPVREEFYASLGLVAISPILEYARLLKEKLGA